MIRLQQAECGSLQELLLISVPIGLDWVDGRLNWDDQRLDWVDWHLNEVDKHLDRDTVFLPLPKR